MDIDRKLDFEYLKLTIALVLLLIIMFLVTSRFRTYPIVIPANPTKSGFTAGAASTKAENFAPYASILAPSTFRSDASHDPELSKMDIPPSGNFMDSSSEHFNGIREHHSYPTSSLDPEFALLTGLTTDYEDESRHHRPHESF